MTSTGLDRGGADLAADPVVPWSSGEGLGADEYRQALREWLDAHVDDLQRFTALPADVAEQMSVLKDLQRTLFDSGWSRLGWPAEAGGLGGSPVLRGVLLEELTLAGYTPPFSFGVVGILAPAVIRFGGPDLVADTVPKVLRGDETWCQGFSEPDAGSDLGSLRTTAAATDGGFILNGQKVWTSWAQFAQRCLVLARTGTAADAHRGITAFLIDMDSPGVTVRELRAMNGHGEFAELFLEDVFVPQARVLGGVAAGWAVTMYVLAHERGAAAWQRGAWLFERLEDLVRALPSGARAETRIGQLYAQLYALRLMSRRTVRDLAAQKPVGPASSIDKILLANVEQALFDAALELLPEQLLLDEDADARQWRGDYLYARAASIYGGSSEIQHGIVAQHLLGLPKGT